LVQDNQNGYDLEKQNSNTTNKDNEINNTNTNENNLNNSSAGSNESNDEVKPKKLTQKDVLRGSNAVFNYVGINKKLPNYITIKGYKYSMPEFMYMLSYLIVYKTLNIKSDISVKYNINNPTKLSGSKIIGKFSKSKYYYLARKTISYVNSKNCAPGYFTTSLGRLQYQTAIYGFSRIMKSYTKTWKMPSHLSLYIPKNHPINKYIPKYGSNKESNILNNNYNGESLNKYKIATKNCQVTNSYIKQTAYKIIKNCKTNLQKATAIFNWVRDNIAYNFYYNTKYGAKNTLLKKRGNCVDLSHLLVALFRASDLAARYVHGTATFSSGNVYGHVWTQVLVGKKWIVADASSTRNLFGVVNNWNPYTYRLKGKYNEILF
jgi:hypothetical protein